jgi:hypothetical protein
MLDVVADAIDAEHGSRQGDDHQRQRYRKWVGAEDETAN